MSELSPAVQDMINTGVGVCVIPLVAMIIAASLVQLWTPGGGRQNYEED